MADERGDRIAKARHDAQYWWARGRGIELANHVEYLAREVEALEDENRWLNRRVAELGREQIAAATSTATSGGE